MPRFPGLGNYLLASGYLFGYQLENDRRFLCRVAFCSSGLGWTMCALPGRTAPQPMSLSRLDAQKAQAMMTRSKFSRASRLATGCSATMSHGPRLGLSGHLTRFFIASPLTPLFLLAGLALGLIALVALPREEEPQISVPMVDIFVSADGLKDGRCR